MKIGVSLKIDVSKIDKAMLFKGQKGTYLDAKVFIEIDQKDQYDNNGMITQEVSKDAPQGTQGAILGNCRVFWNDSQQGQSQGQAPQYSQGQQAQGNGYGQQQQQAPSQNLAAKRQEAQQQPPQFEDDQSIPF